MTPQKCRYHDVTFQYSIGLPSTDDPLIDEKVANFDFSKFHRKEKLFSSDQENLKKEKITTLDRLFLVLSNPLLFAGSYIDSW